jgi:hypothetical protein
MKVDKMSISFEPTLGDAVRAAAARGGRGLSGWLADAAAAKLRAEALQAYLQEYQREHGAFTEEELVWGRAQLGLPAAPDAHAA